MTRRPWTIGDLGCNAGQAADGYAAVFGARALVGYDTEPQPLYPYRFVKADALALLDPAHPAHTHELEDHAALHVSLPCQEFTTAGRLRDRQGGRSRYPDLLTPALALLRRYWTHVAWIVENVDDNRGRVRQILAPRPDESLVMLCGSMFGLQVQRHRLFLTNFATRQPAPVPGPPGTRSKYRALGCDHASFPPDPITGRPRPWGVFHVAGDEVPSGGRTARDEEHGREVMGSRRRLPWANLKEGIPPAYASWIGADLLVALTERDDPA